jgi:hypothetical protein
MPRKPRKKHKPHVMRYMAKCRREAAERRIDRAEARAMIVLLWVRLRRADRKATDKAMYACVADLAGPMFPAVRVSARSVRRWVAYMKDRRPAVSSPDNQASKGD